MTESEEEDEDEDEDEPSEDQSEEPSKSEPSHKSIAGGDVLADDNYEYDDSNSGEPENADDLFVDTVRTTQAGTK